MAHINVTKEIILDYGGTCYNSNRIGFKAIFTNLHLSDNDSNAIDNDKGLDQITDGEGVINIGGLISPNDDISTLDDVKVLQAQASNVPMEQPMDRLKETMQDIMEDCKEA